MTRRARPAWWRKVSDAVLPSALDTLFLQACLLDRERATGAWHKWSDAVTRDGTAIERALARVGSFLTLLAWNLDRHAVEMPPPLATHLRFAQFTEQLRDTTYRRVCRAVFDNLTTAGIPFVVLKGAALGDTVYPDPLLRHSDDINLWAPEDELTRANDILLERGWSVLAEPSLPSPLHLPPLADRSRVPVELHRALLIPHYTLPYDEMWGRSVPARVAGSDVRALGPTDALVHACAHGLTGAPTQRWVADAVFVLASAPAMRWDTLRQTVLAARLAIPLTVALEYLVTHFDAAVPHDLVDGLAEAAAHATWLDRAAARPWPVVPVARGRRGWRSLASRAHAFTRAAFPPPAQLALMHDLRPWQLPLAYLRRLAAYPRLRRTSPSRAGWRARARG